jgi:DNA invertase Pin-like site-specific DNA recombinase
MIIGYARVSTDDQNLDGQIDALEAAGAERIFKEKITGSTAARPELQKLLDQLRKGDVIVVTKYDRLARSLKDLIEIVGAIRERGAGFRSLGEDIDTTTPTGRLIFHVFGSIAEFERERIIERTNEGLTAARKRGRVGGRPPALSADQRDEVRRMRDEERRSITEIARLFKVSVHTVRRT